MNQQKKKLAYSKEVQQVSKIAGPLWCVQNSTSADSFEFWFCPNFESSSLYVD